MFINATLKLNKIHNFDTTVKNEKITFALRRQGKDEGIEIERDSILENHINIY